MCDKTNNKQRHAHNEKSDQVWFKRKSRLIFAEDVFRNTKQTYEYHNICVDKLSVPVHEEYNDKSRE